MPVHAWFANAPSAVPGSALRAGPREAARQAGGPALSEDRGAATAISQANCSSMRY